MSSGRPGLRLRAPEGLRGGLWCDCLPIGPRWPSSRAVGSGPPALAQAEWMVPFAGRAVSQPPWHPRPRVRAVGAQASPRLTSSDGVAG